MKRIDLLLNDQAYPKLMDYMIQQLNDDYICQIDDVDPVDVLLDNISELEKNKQYDPNELKRMIHDSHFSPTFLDVTFLRKVNGTTIPIIQMSLFDRRYITITLYHESADEIHFDFSDLNLFGTLSSCH